MVVLCFLLLKSCCNGGVVRDDSSGGSNPESLSPAGMSCLSELKIKIYVAEDRAYQKLVL